MTQGPLLIVAAVLGLAVPAIGQPAPEASRVEIDRVLATASATWAGGKPDEATRILTTAAETHQSARVLMELARLQSTSGDPAAAVATLRKALSLAPNSEQVLNAFARVSLSARDIGPAVESLLALTRMCPDVADYHYMLGVALMQTSQSHLALQSLERAQALEPGRPRTLIALGMALNGQMRYDDAKPHLQRSVELEPGAVQAWAALAEAEEALDEFDAAEAHARKALSIAADNAAGNLVLGMVLAERGKFAEARDALLRAVASEPRLHKGHYQLSLVYARLGDVANSEKYLELYRKTLQNTQERMKEIRPMGGMGRQNP